MRKNCGFILQYRIVESVLEQFLCSFSLYFSYTYIWFCSGIYTTPTKKAFSHSKCDCIISDLFFFFSLEHLAVSFLDFLKTRCRKTRSKFLCFFLNSCKIQIYILTWNHADFFSHFIK